MTILVCPLSQVATTIEARTPERIVSLLDPDFPFPYTGPRYAGKHLCLKFHDAHVSTFDEVAPTPSHVEELLAFVGQWDRSAPILIHCRAGVGRSTATAFITVCLHNPNADEMHIARALRRASRFARPNELLVRLADAAMNRAGRMSHAISETGRGLSWSDIETELRSRGEGEAFEMPSVFASSL